MAYNAYRNIKSLGIECEIETNSNWRAIKKTRYVDTKTNQMFFRFDSCGKFNRIKLNTISFSSYDAVVISDYDKGFLKEDDIDACLLYTSPSPRDGLLSRMPSSA